MSVVYSANGPDGLYAAIKRVIESSGVVVAGMSPFVMPERTKADDYFIVYNILMNIPNFTTGNGYYEMSRVQIDIYGIDPDVLINMGRTVAEEFDRSSFYIKNGHIAKFLRVNSFVSEDPLKRSEDSNRVFRNCIEFDVTTSITKG